MNILEANYRNCAYHCFTTTPDDGIEYRHCFSSQSVFHFGYAVWLEKFDNGIARVLNAPIFTLTKTAAESLAQEQNIDFRKNRPHRTYHQVNVTKAEFQAPVIKEEYGTLRRWVLERGLDKSDFVITPCRNCYGLSFRTEAS